MRRLEAANEQVLHTLRRAIRSGEYTPAALQRALIRHAAPSENRSGYDALDLLVGGLLDADGLPQERATREPEMVAYQPTPARSILQLIERANIGPADFFYDLGSGLGRVAIVVGLLSGARARGIEFEPAYCEYAQRCARRLNVSGVDFLQADVRDAPLAEGTVYFLYTPFHGELLGQYWIAFAPRQATGSSGSAPTDPAPRKLPRQPGYNRPTTEISASMRSRFFISCLLFDQ